MEWTVGDDIGLRLDCVSDEVKAVERVDEMLERINTIAGEYGYKIRVRGPWPAFRRMAVDEAEYVAALLARLALDDDAEGQGIADR